MTREAFREDGHRPSDHRGFVHKRIARGITSFVSSGFNPLAAISAFVAPTAPRQRVSARPQAVSVVPTTFAPTTTVIAALPGDFGETTVRTRGFRPTPRTIAPPTLLPISAVTGPVDGPCPPPLMRSPAGNCIAPTSPRGAELFEFEAINGRYGAGRIAGSRITDVAVCPSGAVLGKDGICYDHLPNRDRMYPRGRRPLLTGGDMRAISTAARAGKKLDRTNARLRGLGLMRPEAVRKRRRKKVC